MSNKLKLLSLDRPTPRYTSYPPATKFTKQDDTTLRQRMFDSVPDRERLSLYLHIPFCSQLCYYCGCFTAITRKQDRIDRYLSALKSEIDSVSASLPKSVRVAHLHFGGGSPTMLTPEQFSDLLETLHSRFTFEDGAEIAIEADPRQLSKVKIATYAQGGINRISFGVQDFNQTVLKSVNREQEMVLTYKAVEWCRQYNINNINFDLMYGLPYQTVQTIEETMDMAIALTPSRIAYFGYAHVPWMKNHMRAMDMSAMPDSSLRYDLFKAGSNKLAEAGYHAVGIDHFVREEDSMHIALQNRTLKRNFQGYTTDSVDTLIGFGASAISQLPLGFIQNKADISAYEDATLSANTPPLRGYIFEGDDTLRAKIIEQIMCYFKVNLTDFIRDYETYFAQSYERLAPMAEQGLVALDGSRTTIAHDPQLLARIVASAFDSHTQWPDEIKYEASAKHATAI